MRSFISAICWVAGFAFGAVLLVILVPIVVVREIGDRFVERAGLK